MQQNVPKGVKAGSKADIEKQIAQMRKKDKKRRDRSRSRSLSPRSRALARAQHATAAQNERDKEDSDGGDKSNHHRRVIDEAKLEESRKEYAQLKASLLTFKKNKMGTNLDDSNIEVQAKFSAL